MSLNVTRNKIENAKCSVFTNELTGNYHIEVYAPRRAVVSLGILIGFQTVIHSEINTDPRRPDMAAGLFILPSQIELFPMDLSSIIK